MLRPRVALSTNSLLAKPKPQLPDLALKIANVEQRGNELTVPTIIASAIREVIKEQAPAPREAVKSSNNSKQTFTPYVSQPAFSGCDTSLESKDNVTTLKRDKKTLRVKCNTILLPLTQQVPVHIYLTGKETTLDIDGQRCDVDVFTEDGYIKMNGLAKDAYIEVWHNDQPYHSGRTELTTRFHIDAEFKIV